MPSGKSSAAEQKKRLANLLRTRIYACPICGNVIQSTGEPVVSCCGIVLPALEAEAEDETHHLRFEKSEDEYYVTIPHDLRKTWSVGKFQFIYPNL